MENNRGCKEMTCVCACRVCCQMLSREMPRGEASRGRGKGTRLCRLLSLILRVYSKDTCVGCGWQGGGEGEGKRRGVGERSWGVSACAVWGGMEREKEKERHVFGGWFESLYFIFFACFLLSFFLDLLERGHVVQPAGDVKSGGVGRLWRPTVLHEGGGEG